MDNNLVTRFLFGNGKNDILIVKQLPLSKHIVLTDDVLNNKNLPYLSGKFVNSLPHVEVETGFRYKLEEFFFPSIILPGTRN